MTIIKMNSCLIKVTVLLEKVFWVALFEHIDTRGYAAARKIFGSEPTDAELYQFILNDYHELNFTEPHQFKLLIKRRNYKRTQREVSREIEKAKEDQPCTSHAQETLRLELEKNKKMRKTLSKSEKIEKLQEKFLLKQAKRKKKHRGH